MKHTSLKNVLSSLCLITLSANFLSAATIANASVTGDTVSGATYYQVDPGSVSNPLALQVITNPTEPELVALLGGNASLAGGNVELYATSDSASLASFQNAERVLLNLGYTDGRQATLSSLNGQDWFNSVTTGYDLTYGADNLANRWFNDYVDNLNTFPTLLPFTGDRTSLFNSFRDGGGFQQQSDPNISYSEFSGDTITVGLGGFMDIKPRVAALVASVSGLPLATVIGSIPDGIQSSEVVLIDGVPNYGFNAVPSGVVLNDGFNSYTATYEITTQVVPEPSSILLILFGASTLILRRNR